MADGFMIGAAVPTAPARRIGPPTPLFALRFIPADGHPYVVMRDGQRFLVGVREGYRAIAR
jgi:hypothetical protein